MLLSKFSLFPSIKVPEEVSKKETKAWTEQNKFSVFVFLESYGNLWKFIEIW